MVYVGIDVSKHKLDVSVTLDGKTSAAYGEFKNDAGGFKAICKWVSKQARKLNQAGVQHHYGMEATGIYSEGVYEYLMEQRDAIVSLLNPAQVKAFGRSELVRAKTDKADSGLIARYVANMKPAATPVLPQEVKEMRSLQRHLVYLKGRKAEAQGHLESAVDIRVRKSTMKIVKGFEKEIEATEQALEEHVGKHPGLKEKLELLNSIPGIGWYTAINILCEMGVEIWSGGKINGKAQVAHAGLAPMIRESGISVKGKGEICKAGNKRLRHGLYFPAMTACRHNSIIMSFYERLIKNGKSKMVALVASMRKLLMIAIGVLNNGRPFAADWKSKRLTA